MMHLHYFFEELSSRALLRGCHCLYSQDWIAERTRLIGNLAIKRLAA
jgi:hypothetical protein